MDFSPATTSQLSSRKLLIVFFSLYLLLSLLDFMITNQNVMPVMPLLDINYNGMISWESFVGALNAWISHSLCFEGLYRRKIGLTMGSRERQIFHHTIANFFLIAGKGLNNTIPKLNSVLELTGSKFDFQLIDLFQDKKVDKVKRVIVFIRLILYRPLLLRMLLNCSKISISSQSRSPVRQLFRREFKF